MSQNIAAIILLALAVLVGWIGAGNEPAKPIGLPARGPARRILLRALRQIPDRESGVQASPETALAGEPGGGAFAGESH